jgi:hypothetical protein
MSRLFCSTRASLPRYFFQLVQICESIFAFVHSLELAEAAQWEASFKTFKPGE